MISDWVEKYTYTTTCAYMNNAKAQTINIIINQVILVHVDVVRTPVNL